MRRKQSETRQRLATDTKFSITVSEDSGADGFPSGRLPAGLDVPALTLLAHPDPTRVGELVTLPELSSGQTVSLSRLEPLFAPPGSTDPRPLAEPHLSRKPLRLSMSRAPQESPDDSPGHIQIERASSSTPVVLAGRPLTDRRLFDTSDLEHGIVLELGRQVVLLLHLQPALTPRLPRYGLVGDSGAMIRMRQEIQLAARLDTSVLLRGASGTGKELVARAIHDASGRCEKPLVTVNMAAIPSALAAAELFGARKGAYTGADRAKPGFFTAADGGTLFLDEIGDTPADVQPLLLRALESGEIQPVGAAGTRQVDVRVIAATDANLDDAVVDGGFRAPLLHRLAGWEIRLPALADRRSDIGRLLVHFLTEELRDSGVEKQQPPPSMSSSWVPTSLVARLARHPWPGNVRQLRNVARRLAMLHQADPNLPLAAAIEPMLAETSVESRPGPETSSTLDPTAPDNTRPAQSTRDDRSPTGRWRPVYRKASEVDDDELVATLRAQRWDLKPTAEALGVSRSVLYQLIDACPQVRTAAQLEGDEIETALAQTEGDLEAAAAALEVSCHGLKLRLKSLDRRH